MSNPPLLTYCKCQPKAASSGCCGGDKENKENMVLDGNNKLGLEDEEEEEEEDRINNEYVLKDEESEVRTFPLTLYGHNFFLLFYFFYSFSHSILF